MSFKSLRSWSKSLLILFLLLGVLGFEPAFHSLNRPAVYLDENSKLIMDTRAQVVLKHKQRILHSLNQLASSLPAQDKWQLVQLIYQESQEHVVDPQLIVAMIKTESGFRNEARSFAGARGLMQVRFPTAVEIAREMGLELKERKSLHEPQLNIRMGTYYLVKMLRRFEDLELALTAYNIGPTALGRLMVSKLDIPQGYSRRVLKNYRQLRQSEWKTL
jgi:soluble lytic murein transglycosylase